MQLKIEHLSFTYDGAPEAVFADLSLSLDTAWRTGLIARNGRGKTTLLRLLSGDLQGKGKIDCPLMPVLFPYPVADGTQTAWQIAQTAALTCEDWRLMRELSLLNVPEEALNRPFDTLSGGEQTRVMLSALFAREDAYPLIDEPTNSLDAPGRAMLADYLRRKDGFLLVSHDRAFLNRAIDHVVCLNKANTYVMQGNYDTFEARLNGENEAEAARNETLRKEIKQLEVAARKTAEWSNRAEENKRHADKKYYGFVDRGFLGAASERMMKRSKASQVRQERAIEEKQTLLKNVEQVGTLRMTTLPHPKDVLISVENGAVRYGNRTVCENVRFTLCQGERLALIGANGCGKSSILKGILGESDALTGSIRIASGVTFSSVRQRVDDLRGSLRDFIRDAQVDETLFKAILRNMDCPRELFDHDLQEMSQGQRKKILLARSLCEPAHVFVWDEPLNYIDSAVSADDAAGGTRQGVCGAGRHGGGGGIRKGRRCVERRPCLCGWLLFLIIVRFWRRRFRLCGGDQRAMKTDECLRSPFGNLRRVPNSILLGHCYLMNRRFIG